MGQITKHPHQQQFEQLNTNADGVLNLGERVSIEFTGSSDEGSNKITFSYRCKVGNESEFPIKLHYFSFGQAKIEIDPRFIQHFFHLRYEIISLLISNFVEHNSNINLFCQTEGGKSLSISEMTADLVDYYRYYLKIYVLNEVKNSMIFVPPNMDIAGISVTDGIPDNVLFLFPVIMFLPDRIDDYFALTQDNVRLKHLASMTIRQALNDTPTTVFLNLVNCVYKILKQRHPSLNDDAILDAILRYFSQDGKRIQSVLECFSRGPNGNILGNFSRLYGSHIDVRAELKTDDNGNSSLTVKEIAIKERLHRFKTLVGVSMTDVPLKEELDQEITLDEEIDFVVLTIALQLLQGSSLHLRNILIHFNIGLDLHIRSLSVYITYILENIERRLISKGIDISKLKNKASWYFDRFRVSFDSIRSVKFDSAPRFLRVFRKIFGERPNSVSFSYSTLMELQRFLAFFMEVVKTLKRYGIDLDFHTVRVTQSCPANSVRIQTQREGDENGQGRSTNTSKLLFELVARSFQDLCSVLLNYK